MRRLPRAAVVVAVLLGVTGGLTALPPGGRPAGAQQDFVEADPLVVRARAALVAAQASAHQASDQLEATSRELDTVRGAVDERVVRIAEHQAARDALTAQRDALQAVIRARAVALYRNGGDGTGITAVAQSKSLLRAARRVTLGEAAAESSLRIARDLDEAKRQVALAQDALREEERVLRSQQEQLVALAAQQEQRQVVLTQKVSEANALLAQARVIGALHAAGEPVIGPATLTAEQMAAWVQARGFRPRIEVGLVELAATFLDEGGAEGVRGDVAFAQSVIETGGFESAPANNFSGIGWCDSCSDGYDFPTPRDGVRAQMQLLRNYADSGSTAAQLAYPVSPYLYGADPVAAARKFDTFFAKGWAPTWTEMGNGNWATDPGYSAKVIAVYRQMVTYAQGG